MPYEIRPIGLDDWLKRRSQNLDQVMDGVSDIIEKVRIRGDAALIELTEKFDGIKLSSLKIEKENLRKALHDIPDSLRKALEIAKTRIERFHMMQMERLNWIEEIDKGISAGIRVTPIDRVGVYIPGGRASYPSTALMCIVPARVVGVNEICCCTPPPINNTTLAAIEIAGAEEVYSIGGAQAIAAMAFGTESIKGVRKIVGPGNLYVAAAKHHLADRIRIDFPAGPSDLVIVADESADPEFVAADLLAQAEHDAHAMCMLISMNDEISEMVLKAISQMMQSSVRRDILLRSMQNFGLVRARSVSEAISIIDKVAPEHLSIQTREPLKIADGVRNAGSIFTGPYTPVACGDYATGPNHVLPTAGYAKVYSGLSVLDFCKISFVQKLSIDGLKVLAPIVEELALSEGLEGHAQSIKIRLKKILKENSAKKRNGDERG